MLLKPLTSIVLITTVFGSLFPLSQSAIAISVSTDRPMLLATAYTTKTLPTLHRGNQGGAVRKLQKILQSNGFLGAAGVRLGKPGSNDVDGIFGAVTESAIRDLQRRYKLPVTGVVNPATWEILDMKENPYRSPLPWKF